MRFSILGVIIGGLVALFVYAVGTAITTLQHEQTIWGVIAILVWIAIAFSDFETRFNISR